MRAAITAAMQTVLRERKECVEVRSDDGGYAVTFGAVEAWVEDGSAVGVGARIGWRRSRRISECCCWRRALLRLAATL